MPRVASEASSLGGPRPPENARRPEHAPEHPFDQLLDTAAPASEPRPANSSHASERAKPAETRRESAPARDRRADATTGRERANESRPEQKPNEDAPSAKSAEQASEAADPKAAPDPQAAKSTDAGTDADALEADAIATLIDATQPATPKADTPAPIAAAPSAEILLENAEPGAEDAALTPATADAQKKLASIAAAAAAPKPASSASAGNTPPSDAAADAATDAEANTTAAQAAVAQQARPKTKPVKAEAAAEAEGDGKAKTAAQPALGKSETAAAKPEPAPQRLQNESDAAPARERDQQQSAKPQGEQQLPRNAAAERPTLPPDANPRASDALDGVKSAADPAPNNNPSAPGMTVATNHAAAASAVLRADAPAPPIPITGLAVEIAARAVAGRHRFEIRLDPPELGRIDVRLDIDRHGAVTSRLLVDRPETLDLLRRDAAQIERALQDAGLKTAENSLQFMLRDQAFDREQQAQAETDAARIVLADADLNAVDTAPQSHGRWPGLGGGIDIRV